MELAGRNVHRSTNAHGVEVLTISSNVAQGSDQNCKRVLVWAPSGNTGDIYLNLDDDADADDVMLVNDVVYELYPTNCSHLYFYGGTNGDKVYLIWEN